MQKCVLIPKICPKIKKFQKNIYIYKPLLEIAFYVYKPLFRVAVYYKYIPLLRVAVYLGKNKKKIVSRVPSYVDGTQGIFLFLGIFWELKPTFALFTEKIHK